MRRSSATLDERASSLGQHGQGAPQPLSGKKGCDRWLRCCERCERCGGRNSGGGGAGGGSPAPPGDVRNAPVWSKGEKIWCGGRWSMAPSLELALPTDGAGDGQLVSDLSCLGDLLGERLGDRRGERLGEPGVTGGEARGDPAAPDTGDASAEPRDMPHSDEPLSSAGSLLVSTSPSRFLCSSFNRSAFLHFARRF